MWVYTTNNEIVNLAQAQSIELRQETSFVAGEEVQAPSSGNMVGISIVAKFGAENESQLAFIAAAPNYDMVVNRYWNALRTAIKSRAEICDLMDIA